MRLGTALVALGPVGVSTLRTTDCSASTRHRLHGAWACLTRGQAPLALALDCTLVGHLTVKSVLNLLLIGV